METGQSQPNLSSNPRVKDKKSQNQLSDIEPAAIPAASWQETMFRDPVFIFFWKYRSHLFALALVILLGVFYYRYSQEAHENTMKEAARVLAEGRQELVKFEQLAASLESLKSAATNQAEQNQAEPTEEQKSELEKTQADIDASAKLLDAKFAVLQQSPSIYGVLGQVYDVVIKVKKDQLSEALAAVQQLDYRTTTEPDQRLYQELAWLMVARAVLDQDELRSKGLEMLNNLIKEGQHVAVPAAITLTNLAESQEEKDNIKQQLEDLLTKHPEQSELVEEALGSL